MRRNAFPAPAVLAGVLFLISVLPARAATFVVTTTADGNHGACTVSLCTLRDAVIAANANAGADVITLPSNASPYTFTLAGANEDNAATGDLDIRGDLTINGGGAATTVINAAGLDRVFQTIGAVTVIFNDVTITGGNSTGVTGSGGGIQANAGSVTLNNCVVTNNQAAGQGAGIFATNLTLSNTTISNNTSSADQGGGLFLINGTSSITNSTISFNTAADDGGGIYLNGSINPAAPAVLTITNSTFNNNQAPDGAGMFILSEATVTITGSTFTVNNALTGGGGGINNLEATLSLTNCTFNQNVISGGTTGGTAVLNTGGNTTITNCTIDSNVMSSGPGAGVANSGGTINVHNTIIEANSGGNCSGPIVNGGGNLQNPGTDCGATITTAAALLQALDNNGGPTQTQSLGAGSPAIDAAVGCPPPSTDQRGIARPQRSACDIGAFECQTSECGGVATTVTPTPTQSAATATPTPTSTSAPPTATTTSPPFAGAAVPTLSFPMFALLGLALAGVALLLLKR